MNIDSISASTADWTFLPRRSAMCARIAGHDWAASPIGRPKGWPGQLKTLLNVMLGSTQPMFVAWGPERTLFYNDPYAAILADKHPSALGRDFLSVWEEIRSDLAPIVAAAYRGEPTQMDDIALMMLRRGYLEEAHFSFSYTPVRDEAGAVAGLFCACAEITDKVKAERRLAAERKRDQLMFRSMPGFVAFLTGPEHRFDYVNEAFLALVGEREVIGRPVRPVFPELADQGFFDLLDQVYATGEPFVSRGVEVRLDREDGERVIDLLFHPVRDEGGRVTGVFASGYDVTEQFRAQSRANAEAARVKAVLDGMAEGFALLDHDLRFLDINAEALRIDGRSREELVGADHSQAFPGSQASEIGRLYQHALAEQTPVAREHRFVWPGGHEAWLDMRAYPVPEGLAIFFRDISDRKEVERRLRESETRFRNMADHAPVMMWVTEADGRCSYLNRAWHAFTGQDEAAALGYGWLDAVHPDDRQAAEEAFREATLKRQSFRLEYRLRRADGVFRWTIDAAGPRFDGEDRFIGFIGSVVDIDERREAEERMRARSEELAALLDAAPAVIWVAHDKDARLVTGNRLASDLLRMPSADANMSRTADDPSPTRHFRVLDRSGREVDGDELPVQRAARGETVRNIEERIVFDDGASVDMLGNAVPLRDGAGRLRGSVAAFVDITERKRVEAALKSLNDELEQRVISAVSERNRLWAVTEDLFVTAGFDGRLLEISDSWSRVFGWDREALLGRPAGELVHPDDLPMVQSRLEALARTGRSTAYENRVRTRDGQWRTVAWRLSAEPGGGRIYGVGRDVTTERAQAQALAEAERKLYEVQKMESIGQLTGGVAHDFNNLLSAILSTLDVARKGVHDAKIQRLIDGAIKGAERGAALTKRLLAFARRQELRAETVSVPALFADMQELLARSLGPGVRIVAEFPDDLPLVRIDANQLELALLNLAVNARDAMPNGGALTVTASAERIEPGSGADVGARDRREGLRPGDYVKLCVADTGGGMDAETLARAVEPFFTTKGVGKGTGLGLSMVQGLALQSGGAMRIVSAVGAGTRVELHLPQATDDGEARAAAPMEEREMTAGKRTLTILVVDDDALVALGTVAMLEDFGHEVIEAQSGPEALALLDGPRRIDLVITDHAMPGMTGTELVARLAERDPGLPVILATGYAELPNGEASNAPRLEKPLRQDDLAAMIEAVFSRREAAPAA